MKERCTLTVNCKPETYTNLNQMIEDVSIQMGVGVSKSLFIDYCINKVDTKAFMKEHAMRAKGKKRIRNE